MNSTHSARLFHIHQHKRGLKKLSFRTCTINFSTSLIFLFFLSPLLMIIRFDAYEFQLVGRKMPRQHQLPSEKCWSMGSLVASETIMKM